MIENKPILFINSARSGDLKDQNQYVYDSRFSKKNPEIKRVQKVKEEKKEEKPAEIKKETVPETKTESVPEVKVQEAVDNKTLVNKMELLNKRARLGRYVLISLETADKTMEGFFIEKLEDAVIIRQGENEDKVKISDIKNIDILKV